MPLKSQSLNDPIELDPNVNPCNVYGLNTCHGNNEICILDDDGSYHCECESGYSYDSSSTCTLCGDQNRCLQYDFQSDNDQDYRIFCDNIENSEICLDQESRDLYNSQNFKGGVLICSEENLEGVCKVIRENRLVNNSEYPTIEWYKINEGAIPGVDIGISQKSPIKSLKVIGNWEVYAINHIESIPREPNENKVVKIVENDQIVNINREKFLFDEDENSNFNLNDISFIVQPADYVTFSDVYGSATPYVELQHRDQFGDIILREVLKDQKNYSIGDVQSKHFIKSDLLDYIIVRNCSVVLTKENSSDQITTGEIDNSELILNLFLDKNGGDWDNNGLIFCNRHDVDYDRCYNIKDHILLYKQEYNIYTNELKDQFLRPDSNNEWSYQTDNVYMKDPISYSNDNVFDYMYLHDGWKGFACENRDDNFDDCVQIPNNETIESLSELGLSKVEALFVQPENSEKFEQFFGENRPYITIFDSPDYKGNYLFFHEEGKYYNPIKSIRSLYRKGDIKLYANNKYINKSDILSFDLKISKKDKIEVSKDKTIESEGISLNIDIDGQEKKMIFMGDNKYQELSNIYLSGKSLTNISIKNFKSLIIRPGWEGYICFDNTECYYFRYGKNWNRNDFISLGSKKIVRIIVQPKTHNKLLEVYGHAEYPYQWGYLELYPDTCWKKMDQLSNIYIPNLTVLDDLIEHILNLWEQSHNLYTLCSSVFNPEIELGYSKELNLNSYDAVSGRCQSIDIDEDGKTDLAGLPYNGRCYWCENTGEKAIRNNGIPTCKYTCSKECKNWEFCGKLDDEIKCIKHPGTKQIFAKPLNNWGNIELDDINIDKDSIFKNIKSIVSIGNLKFNLMFNSVVGEPLNKKLYIIDETEGESEKIVSIKPHISKPSISISDSNDTYSYGLGYSFYSNYPDENIIKQYYSSFNKSNLLNSSLFGYIDEVVFGNLFSSIFSLKNEMPESTIAITKELYSEEYQGDKYMDNSDLHIIISHGSWNIEYDSENNKFIDKGSYNAILNNGGIDIPYNFNQQRAMFGDSDTEWLILNGCNTLGTEEDKCYKSIPNEDDGIEMDCIAYYDKTKAKDVMRAYRVLFANGLHGLGGHFKKSYRFCYGDNNECDQEGYLFWNLMKYYARTVGDSYVLSDYNSDVYGNIVGKTYRRNTGYIGAGKCTGNKSYTHNDHFWTMGITLPDPDKKFLIENGFCYYSGASGDRYRDFMTVSPNPEDQWIIYDQGDIDITVQEIITNLTISDRINSDYIVVNDGVILYQYPYSKVKDFYILANNNSDSLELDFDFDINEIERLYGIVEQFSKNVFDDFLTSQGYELGKFSVTLFGDQEYTYEGVKDGKGRVYEVKYKLNYFIDGHPFFKKNTIEIGINPLTEEITSLKINIDSISETDSVISNDTINNYTESLKLDENENYIIGYILSDDKKYRPAVVIIDENKGGISKIMFFKEDL